ncbi:hsp70 protein [Ditylenchus destructor]|nr:hsp70 protein [Ditylenchus destructor]
MTTDAIAIDLGARNCRAAIFRNGSVEILRNIDENLFIPSILTIKRGRNIVGSQALNTLPSNVIYDACQEASASQNDALKWYAQANSDGRYYLKDGPSTGQPVSQQEAIAMLLKHIKTEMAEQILRRPVDRAVICIPAYAGENYRAVVYEAAQLAGFKGII